MKKILPKLRPDKKVSKDAMLDGLIFIEKIPSSECDSLGTDKFVKTNTHIPNSKKKQFPKPQLPDSSFILPGPLTVQNSSSKKKKA